MDLLIWCRSQRWGTCGAQCKPVTLLRTHAEENAMRRLWNLPWKKRVPVVFAVSLFVIAAALFTFLSVHSSKQSLNAFGICRGFSAKPINEIPTSAIRAAKVYLKTDFGIGVADYALPVDPVRESSVPHRCKGVRDDINPYSLDQLLTDKKEIAALAAKQRHYSGVIPPGATRALRISVLHHATRPKYTGTDPVVIQFLNSTSAYTSSDLIVAYYPKRGWVGVFEFPAQGGWPAYP